MPVTPSGYDAHECASAMQKGIRRGEEETALWFGLQLAQFNVNWAWKRLIVIASEDVGLASPETVLLVDTLRRQAADLKDKDEAWLMLTNAILALARAPKSRLADNAFITMMQRQADEWRPDVPDYALDKHTRRGKAQGRSWRHFVDEGAHLANDAGIDPYQGEAAQNILRWEREARPTPTQPSKESAMQMDI